MCRLGRSELAWTTMALLEAAVPQASVTLKLPLAPLDIATVVVGMEMLTCSLATIDDW